MTGYAGCDIIFFGDAAIAQSVVRNIGSVEVTGSIPVSSLKKEYPFGIFFFLCTRASGARAGKNLPLPDFDILKYAFNPCQMQVLQEPAVRQRRQHAAAFQVFAAAGLPVH